MAQNFMGKTIYLVSHSDIRYRGTLAGVDPVQTTIQLSNVYSMGTENRRPADQFIPPNPEPYHYIVFRASEVKDLAVDNEPPPAPPVQRALPNDPAILSSEAQGPPRAYAQAAVPAAPAVVVSDTRRPAADGAGNHSMGGRGGGRRGGRQPHGGAVPPTDFDFQGSNARFDKASLGAAGSAGGSRAGTDGTASPGGGGQDKAYNPQSSFFDSLSSSSDQQQGQGQGQGQSGGGGGGGGGGGYRGGRGRGRGGYGRSRREEERQKNVATFGEPGGLGLLGPGAYVGGYGRRGGGRGGRRGGVAGS